MVGEQLVSDCSNCSMIFHLLSICVVYNNDNIHTKAVLNYF